MYHLLPTTINSLLRNNEDDIERIYLFIEDDQVDYIRHSKIQFINCNNYDFLIREGLNISDRFPYMATVRCFISKILKEDKILYLDVDTIVDGKLIDLWNGASEILCAREEREGYFNSGVMVLNLEQIRRRKYDDLMAKLLEKCKFIYPDQDCINAALGSHSQKIDYKWNAIGDDRVYEYDLVVRHWAGRVKPWKEKATQKDKVFWNKYKVDYINDYIKFDTL